MRTAGLCSQCSRPTYSFCALCGKPCCEVHLFASFCPDCTGRGKSFNPTKGNPRKGIGDKILK